MSYQARVEELSDSDPDEMDITELDHPSANNAALMKPANIPVQGGSGMSSLPSRESQADKRARTKRWQCLYPLYFDASRSLKEGRRVSKQLAVRNPLAHEIMDAVHSLGLDVAFEADAFHPKDWSNPGRVKTLIKDEGWVVRPHVSNKHHLFVQVATYLKNHPTTETMPLKVRIQGLPTPAEPLPPPAVPRGWKMGKILPLHSPAVTGGGVSDNLFAEMQKEMLGQSEDVGSGSGKAKKDKKKIKG